MSKPFRLPIIFLALLVAGCYPLSSKYPLGNRAADSELVGVWSGEELELQVTQRRRNHLTFKFTPADEAEDGEPDVLFYDVLPSLIEDKHFLSVKQIFPTEFLKAYARAKKISLSKARRKFRKRDRRMNGYYLGYYDIVTSEGSDELTIYLMDGASEMIAVAIEDGTLNGSEVNVKDEDGEEDEILYLTSSTRTLTKFVASHADAPGELFDLEIAKMVRVEE